MTIISLQLQIDSEVLPELHAALANVSNSAARAERLRQLASSGLIWEQLRRSPNTVAANAAPPGPRLPDGARLRADDVTSVPVVVAAMAPASDPNSAPGGHSDLAPGPAGAAASPNPDVDVGESVELSSAGKRMAAALPVLNDVIDDAQWRSAGPLRNADPVREAVPARPQRTPLATVAAPTASESWTDASRPDSEAADGAPQRKSATRTRLARMQEKGLFRNG